MATYITKAVSAAESTTTSTSLQDKVTLTFAAGDQEANAVYYIVAWAQVYNGTAGAKVNLHLVNSTDAVTYQDLEPAPALADTEKIGQLMLGIYTAASTPVEKAFKIQYCAVSGTAKIQKACIYIFKKGADDADNESTGKTDATGTYVDKASVTFTPASQGFYWLLGCAEYFMDAGDRPYGRITVGGTLQAAAEIVDTPSTDSRNSIGISWVEELAASSQTVAFGIRDTSTFSDVYNARIICMRLDEFPGYWYDEELTNDTTPATSYEQKTAITQTLAAVEHLAIACVPARSSNTASINIVVTLKVDSTAVVENLSRPRGTFGIECIDGHIAMHGWTGSGSSTTIEAGWHFSSSASGNLDDNSLLVLQLESAGVSGTASITEAADTASATATVRISGAASITEAADTSSGTATILLQATAAITEAGDTIAATGALAGEISGTASITEASDTVSSAGTVLIAGTASIAESGDTAASAGTIRIAAAASIAEASDTTSATGTVGLSAAATIAEASDTATSAGTLRIAGLASITEASDASAASGKIAIAGTCTITEAGDTCAATGTFGSVIAGTASISEASDTVSASGTVRIAATVAITEASDTASGMAQVAIAAAASIAEASDTSTATGRLALLGTATIAEAADTVSAAGTILAIGGLDLPAGTYAFRWTHGERSMAWTHGERGFDWTHGERSFRHVDG